MTRVGAFCRVDLAGGPAEEAVETGVGGAEHRAALVADAALVDAERLLQEQEVGEGALRARGTG